MISKHSHIYHQCHTRATSGVTLFEILVAILIIALLAAISGPIYTSYVVKSKFTQVFTTISKYRDELQVAYVDHGFFPEQIGDLTAGDHSSISSPVLNLLYYDRDGANNAAYMFFFTADLGVEDYVAPDENGSGAQKARIAIAAVATNTGHMKFYCGQWDGSDIDLQLEYLPKACQDTDISDLF